MLEFIYSFSGSREILEELVHGTWEGGNCLMAPSWEIIM